VRVLQGRNFVPATSYAGPVALGLCVGAHWRAYFWGPTCAIAPLRENLDSYAPESPLKECSVPAGRPSTYTVELAREICERIAHGEVLNQICRDEHMPARPTVIGWLRAHPEFDAEYIRSREQMMDIWAEEVVEISEDGTNDWMEREIANGRVVTVTNAEATARSKLRVDSRKWLLSKLRPETYGDSQRIDLKGKITLSEKEIDGQLAALLLKATAKKGDAE